MTSVVYYKFKSQKEPSKVTFDGTGISVFDLKREIILNNKLANTADSFDLHIVNPDTKEEYEDDTEVIPRSMSVVARRLPASRPGRDSAAKYVSGAMTATMRRRGGPGPGMGPAAGGPSSSAPVSGVVGTEDDKISAMFQAQGESWRQTQETMATATPVYFNRNNAPAPDTAPPPPTYQCHRCGHKGHWIQNCPTNNDPNWEGKRVRRTTGIPKSMLRTVAQPAEDADAYMINEDGEYVVAVADNKSWQNYQTRAARAQDQAEADVPAELLCPISKKLFVKPVTTPCCKTTYSEDSIQQALLDSDFVCPKCETTDVLLDQLTPNKDMEAKVEEYKKQQQDNKEGDEGGEEEKKRKREEEVSEQEADKKQKTEAVPDMFPLPFFPPIPIVGKDGKVIMPPMPPFMMPMMNKK